MTELPLGPPRTSAFSQRTLGDLVGKVRMLDFVCPCGRRGRYRAETLVARFGASGSIHKDVLPGLAADCPQLGPIVPIWSRCRICCPTLARLAGLGG